MGHGWIRTIAALWVSVISGMAGAAVFTVTSTADSGAGTLRQAILDAESNAGPDEIQFDLSGSLPYTITPLSPLAEVTESVRIDGTTQAGYSGTPVVVIDGSSLPGAQGIYFSGGQNTVKGLVFSSFFGSPVLAFDDGTSSNVLQGCYIGTDPTGDELTSPSVGPVEFHGCDGNLIGGAAPGEGNVIAGTLQIYGSSENRVFGNHIGMNVSGTTCSEVGGLQLYESRNSQIGGSTAAMRNLIYGRYGALSIGVTTDTTIQGNWIGLRGDGMSAFEDMYGGLSASGSHRLIIGGSQPGQGNVIAGHGVARGIYLTRIDGCVIQGNRVGTTADGMQALDSFWGIDCRATGEDEYVRDILIGGTEPGAGNVVSGHETQGIYMTGRNAENIIVQGNKVGTDILGTGALGNTDDGIVAANGAHDILIGGTEPGAGNIVAYNRRVGVNIKVVTSDPDGTFEPQRVSVLGNSIYGNERNGLDLAYHAWGDGPTANDEGDADEGPNGYLNTPILTRVVAPPGGGVQVEGTYSSAPNATYRLEFFASASLNIRGRTEGQRLLGWTEVTTDATGNAVFDIELEGTGTESEIYSATATDTDGNTSEFSPESVETVPIELSSFTLE